MNFGSPLRQLAERGRGWGYFLKTPFTVITSPPAISLATTKPSQFSSIAETSIRAMVLLISF